MLLQVVVQAVVQRCSIARCNAIRGGWSSEIAHEHGWQGGHGQPGRGRNISHVDLRTIVSLQKWKSQLTSRISSLSEVHLHEQMRLKKGKNESRKEGPQGETTANSCQESRPRPRCAYSRTTFVRSRPSVYAYAGSGSKFLGSQVINSQRKKDDDTRAN